MRSVLRTEFLIGVACLTVLPAGRQTATAQDTKPGRHSWSEITYPHLPVATPTSLVTIIALRNGKDDGLVFAVTYSFRPSKKAAGQVPPLEKMAVRLHTPDGRVTDAKAEDAGGQVNLGIAEIYYEFRFPWRGNVLEEAWIEVRLPQQTYWVEVPYGFTRNQADPLKPAKARSGSPKYPRTMKPGEDDWLVPWLEVKYEVATDRNDLGLRLNISNRAIPKFEVVLNREGPDLDDNDHPWKLESVCLEVKEGDAPPMKSKHESVELQGGQRVDSFRLDAEYADNERTWGTVVIKVDGKAYKCVVPSSMYLAWHGAVRQGSFKWTYVPWPRER